MSSLGETRQLGVLIPQRNNGNAHFAFLVKDKECLSSLDQDRVVTRIIVPLRTEIIVVDAECGAETCTAGACSHTQPWQPRLLFATARRSVNNISPSLDYISDKEKIVAIGRNYADHVKELKNTLPTEPFFFLKPTTSYLPSGGIIEIPRGITAHHESAFP